MDLAPGPRAAIARRIGDGTVVIMSAMAGYQALSAAGTSIVALLNRRFEEDNDAQAVHLKAELVGNEQLKHMQTGGAPRVTVYCYKVTVDRETRPGWSSVANYDGIPRLPLRLHFLLSAWARHIADELGWLGLAARVLESESILTGPLLDPSGHWGAGDAIQIVTDEIPLEPMSEAFQSLHADYRLSLPYIVRVICIDGTPVPTVERVATVADRVEPVLP